MNAPLESGDPLVRCGAMGALGRDEPESAGEVVETELVTEGDHRDELDVLRVRSAELADGEGHLVECGLDGPLVGAGHDAGADGGHGHVREPVDLGLVETSSHDLAQRALQVVDDEDDVAELKVQIRSSGREVGATVVLPAVAGYLTVERVARDVVDGVVDASEPHATRVDGSDERVGLDLRDVAVDKVHASHDYLLRNKETMSLQ